MMVELKIKNEIFKIAEPVVNKVLREQVNREADLSTITALVINEGNLIDADVMALDDKYGSGAVTEIIEYVIEVLMYKNKIERVGYNRYRLLIEDNSNA